MVCLSRKIRFLLPVKRKVFAIPLVFAADFFYTERKQKNGISLLGEEAGMGFISILDRRESPYKEKERPAFFQDLNLDQVIERIRLDWGWEVSSFYSYFPADASCEDYRREVFEDIRLEGAYGALCEFVEEMRRRREAAALKGEVEQKLQKAVWHLREVDCYCGAFRHLAGKLEGIPVKSHGMLLFREYLEGYLAREDFRRMEAQAAGLLEKMSAFRLVLTYENDRMTITEGEAGGAYEQFLEKCFPENGKEFRSPFEASPEWADLERELIKTYRKRNPDFFTKTEEFYGMYAEYGDKTLLRFASEIEFYLSFWHFEKRMAERGFAFAVPKMAGEDASRSMYAHGLYDLALACAGHEVVSNDMEFKADEKFYVLTGPNQGGKTTYARSLGQLVYFAKMGLDVPAASAQVYRFKDILTHFSVEESIETGRGKLKEELMRLAPMMEASPGKQRRAFVVINELFTTAANYDACIMGKRVLEHFLSQDCHGIYVTHLKELGGAYPGIVSLRALRDEKGVPNFRIARGSEESGASAGNLVEKHGLTYERLKERLA